MQIGRLPKPWVETQKIKKKESPKLIYRQVLLGNKQTTGLTTLKKTTLWHADLFGVELHLALGLGEKLDIVGSVDLLSNYSNLVRNRELKRKQISTRVLDFNKSNTLKAVLSLG